MYKVVFKFFVVGEVEGVEAATYLQRVFPVEGEFHSRVGSEAKRPVGEVALDSPILGEQD